MEFFVEDETRRFALTPPGRIAALGCRCARSTVRMLGGPFMWPAIGEMLHSLETGRPAFEKAMGQPVFDFLGLRSEQARIFNEAMIGFHGAEPPAVAAGDGFSGIRTLVDTGGGIGNLLTTILEVYPSLHGVLFDLPARCRRGTPTDCREGIGQSL